VRVLVMSSPVPTHLTPMAPLCWAIRAAGHPLLVVGRPDLAAAAASCGLSLAAIGERYDEAGLRRRRGVPWRPPRDDDPPQEPPWPKLGEMWRTRIAADLPAVLSLARRWRPDLILADPLEFAALAVGGLLGVPVVQHRFGNDAWSLQVAEPAREQLAGLCRESGLPDGLPSATLLLDVRPPSLRCGPVHHPLRPVPSNGTGTRAPWLDERRAARRVCVTLGRRVLDLGAMPLLQRVLRACATPGVEVVTPIEERWRADLGPVPPTVRVVDPLPLELFLDTCDLVVHHAGSSTGNTAVALGVRQLVLPVDVFGRDLAAAVNRAGIGAALDGAGQEDPDLLRATVTRLLDDPAVAGRARAVAREVDEMPSPAAVVQDLVRLSGRAA